MRTSYSLLILLDDLLHGDCDQVYISTSTANEFTAKRPPGNKRRFFFVCVDKIKLSTPEGDVTIKWNDGPACSFFQKQNPTSQERSDTIASQLAMLRTPHRLFEVLAPHLGGTIKNPVEALCKLYNDTWIAQDLRAQAKKQSKQVLAAEPATPEQRERANLDHDGDVEMKTSPPALTSQHWDKHNTIDLSEYADDDLSPVNDGCPSLSHAASSQSSDGVEFVGNQTAPVEFDELPEKVIVLAGTPWENVKTPLDPMKSKHLRTTYLKPYTMVRSWLRNAGRHRRM